MRIIEGLYEMQQAREIGDKKPKGGPLCMRLPRAGYPVLLRNPLPNPYQFQLISSDLCREVRHAKDSA
jgi:hypothetical protein